MKELLRLADEAVPFAFGTSVVCAIQAHEHDDELSRRMWPHVRDKALRIGCAAASLALDIGYSKEQAVKIVYKAAMRCNISEVVNKKQHKLLAKRYAKQACWIALKTIRSWEAQIEDE